ncbi:hypothetical protein HK096_002519 [Nowakowskiella sp. JEL0078]|nr:hypothetical protein HK096_002519 [Nowakowskiella sp. JEL0078]
MGIEATMLVVDNSEWMRNGDYTPTRIEAQSDAITLLFNAKTQQNAENTVGMMTMAGKSPEVLVTLTDNFGKILTALHNIKISGNANISTGVQIAQLALKHRQNKTQKQRIVVFVGSPIEEDEKSLVKIAKKLKKNNVSVDIVNFGEEAENTEKLEAFIAAVNSSDNSHLVTIPPGPHILSDVLLSSPIVAGEDGAPPGFAAGGGGGFDFVDPSLDPELALALRISLEEERARQEATTNTSGESMQIEPATVTESSVPLTDDEIMLQEALKLSRGEEGGDEQMELTEDEEIARALEFSLQQDDSEATDADLVSILSGLPGVDPNDPRIKDALSKKEGEKK